jgi:TonB family protein
MTLLLDLALRSSAPVLVALLACRVLSHRSAALRHRVLAAAVMAGVVVVPLSMVLPSWRVPLAQTSVVYWDAPAVPEASAGAVEAIVRAGPLPAAAANAWQLVFLVWITGVAVGTVLLLVGVTRLVRLTLGAEEVLAGDWRRLTTEIAATYGIRRRIVVLTTRGSAVLATYGLLRPRVLLPAQACAWGDDRAYVALCHELAHIRRCDWPVQVGAELLRAVFWFNPLLWMLCARLRCESDHACDDAVLGTGVPAATYASHLVEIAKACRQPASGWVLAMSIARPSTLERRITAMLNTRLNRQAPTQRAMALILAALVGLVLPTASVDVSAQDPGARALTGYVYDTTGSVLPAVDVTLVTEQQARWSVVTDERGNFEFNPVGAGTYVLEVTLRGFRTLRNDFTLAVSRDWNRNITLQVGELEEKVRVTAKRPTQAVRASSSGGGEPIRIGGNIKAPRKLKDVWPVYPPTMRDAGLDGSVPMEALIATDGSVASVRVLSAQVHPEFARAAEEAVRQWVFSPTLLNGAPVEVRMTVSVQFSLED